MYESVFKLKNGGILILHAVSCVKPTNDSTVWGVYLLGTYFTVDEEEGEAIATSLNKMHTLAPTNTTANKV